MLKTGWLRTGLTLAAVSAVAAFSFGLGAGSVEAAVVYCKTVGVPQGCVVRPAPRVVYCKRVGVPRGCVMVR
jgi:hypothetical protein